MMFKTLLAGAAALAIQQSLAQGNTTTPGSNSSDSDLDILNYALTLEHLEYAFYRDGISLLGSNTSDPVYPRLVQIRDHEKAHVQALTTAITQLGGTPVDECEYDFGYTDAQSFLNIARSLENVGTSAYDGAAWRIKDQRLLTAAATIATVEARHASYLNNLLGTSPFPTAFDSPLDQTSVLGLASAFITNCSNASLSFTPRPQLVVDPLVVSPGSTVNVTSDALSSGNSSSNSTSSDLWCIFYAASASTNSTLQKDQSSGGNSTYFCRVPESAYPGDNFVFLSTQQAYNLADTDSIVAGPALVVVLDNTNTTGGGGSGSTNSTTGGGGDGGSTNSTGGGGSGGGNQTLGL